jgi:hypothetical protein
MHLQQGTPPKLQPFTDLYYMLYFTILIATSRKLFMHLVKPPLIKYLEHLRTKNMEQARIKAPRQLFDFFYYSLVTVWGFYISWDHYTIPSYLGGSGGNGENIYKFWPETDPVPNHVYYFMF